jgi:uncharacterized protein YqgV (UPF0045/DUF77 family)
VYHVEFTVEPFVEGRPGPHVMAAVSAAEAAGAQIEFGPFGSLGRVPADYVDAVVSGLTRAAFEAGASRVTIQVTTETSRLLTEQPPDAKTARASSNISQQRDPQISDSADLEHPVVQAIRPTIDAVGASLVDPEELSGGDIPLVWEGTPIAGVRRPMLHGALQRLIESVEAELGGDLPDLSREAKQAAVRLLDERGAFTLRRAVEDVADAMNVSRITVYNYLNAIHR